MTEKDCIPVSSCCKEIKFGFLTDIALGPKEELMILDNSNKWIIMLDNKFNLLKIFGQGSGISKLDYPFGIAVADNFIVVSDCGSHEVKKYSLQGELLSVIGSYGHEKGQFKYPRGLAISDNKFLYVVDGENHRVQVFQQDGTFAFSFGNKGSNPGQFQRPIRITTDSNSNLLVTDCDANCIHLFSGNGQFIQKINCYEPRAVIVSPAGYVITSHDEDNSKIRVWSPKYQLINQFGKRGSKQREFDGIRGMVISSSGNIHVVEWYNQRLQVIISESNIS